MSEQRLAINALDEELEQAVDFCRAEEIGIEVTAFAFPAGLDEGYRDRVRRYASTLAGLSPISCHGPFMDLHPASHDPEIVGVCRRRHERALEAATEIGASLYVAHLSFLPLIRNRSYRDGFVDGTVTFWTPLADRAAERGMTIVLENLWEQDPDLQKDVVARAAHPALKASFDNGHALVFSVVPASQWVEVLGDDLAHCHLHDNGGLYDEHKPIGEGREDWDSLFDALRSHAPEALLILESDRLNANQASLKEARRYLAHGAEAAS